MSKIITKCFTLVNPDEVQNIVNENFKIGDKVLVYDSRTWDLIGFDVDKNEHCWQPAIIEDIKFNVISTGDFECYFDPVLFDIRFLHDNRLSHCHFLSSVKKIMNA
ncbi:MAG: hypothetical protein Q8910_00105 [Bacteroidota bacterium]|nr:hypothetical protein [Bacteroidota bacterium]